MPDRDLNVGIYRSGSMMSEDTLPDSEMVHTPNIAFYEYDPATEDWGWSPTAASVLGFAPDELPNSLERWRETVHPADRSHLDALIEWMIRTRLPVRMDYRILRSERELLSIREEASILPSGRITGCIRISGISDFEMMSSFTEAIPVGTLVVNSSGIIVHANQPILELFQYQYSELVGQLVEVLIPERIRERHVKDRMDYFSGPTPTVRPMMGRELFARRKDGSEIAVAVGLTPRRLDHSMTVVVNIFDLSECKRATSELQRFFELSVDLLFITNPEGRFQRVNLSFTRMLGYSQQEILSQSIMDLAHPEEHTAVRLEMRKLAAGAATVRLRSRFRDRNGTYRWLEWHASAIAESSEVFAIARDVTEQIALEKLLFAQEQRERAILDNTSAVIYVKSEHGRYEFVNRAFLALFKLQWEDLIGKTDNEIFPEPFASQFIRNDSEVIRTKTPITIEELVPRPDGGLRTFVSIKVPLPTHSGRVALAGISTDITDQLRANQAEEELKLARIVQQRLYPASFPAIAGFDVSGASLPMAQLCGDYYDYVFDEGRNKLWLAVGDVSGHGLGPGLTMVEIRSLLRVLLPESGDLASTFRQVNRTLLVDSPEFFFVTLFVVEFDLTHRTASYIGAGHDAWMLRNDGRRDWIDSTGPPLGLVDFDYEHVEFPGGYLEGDILLLFTDGVPEAMSTDEKLFGRERMVDAVERHRHESATQIVEALFGEVQSFAHGQLKDDITTIVLKVLPSP